MSGIAAIRIVTRDADWLGNFYVRAFGFVRGRVRIEPPDPFATRARRLLPLRLGAQRIELLEVDGGTIRATPVPCDDARFQHFAMVAPDMTRAHARLCATRGWTPITLGGPLALPERSGGATAFKFRDPEGHPLELLSFPPGRATQRWADAPDDDVIGIDHTAIVVEQTERSLTHYASLGFVRTGGSVNYGAEQDTLDRLQGSRVEVTALELPDGGGPHLELLCYRGGGAAGPIAAGDLVATRTVMGGGDAFLADPDGHRWIVPLRLAEGVPPPHTRPARFAQAVVPLT